jgi:hexokinase
MSMGKGFTITSNLDLGKQLREGYAKSMSHRNLPKVKIVAIVNDAVATFVSFVYQLNADPRRKAAIGLIVGTGNNATIPLKLSNLHLSKRPKLGHVAVAGADESGNEMKIVVNTEWSINGTAPPLRELDLITRWDTSLDLAGEAPGFMPFEYMTSGRYLGELGRLIVMEYLTSYLGIAEDRLPERLRRRHGLTTTFLGNLGSHKPAFDGDSAISQLQEELPTDGTWNWTLEAAEAIYYTAKAIQVRAAGMTSAAIIGLLACAEEIPTLALNSNRLNTDGRAEGAVEELTVGYTGGCIVHFQDYLRDCQEFLNQIMDRKFKDGPYPSVVLHPCNDGGIIGAGVLAGAVRAMEGI